MNLNGKWPVNQQNVNPRAINLLIKQIFMFIYY